MSVDSATLTDLSSSNNDRSTNNSRTNQGAYNANDTTAYNCSADHC